jgi:prepilin-type N-terminal cleavage/methylation domain-containing protein
MLTFLKQVRHQSPYLIKDAGPSKRFMKPLYLIFGMRSPAITHKGFTLIEMMSTIAIAGVLAFFTLPPLIDWIQVKKNQQNTQQILNIIKAARQKAMATKRPETLTFTPNSQSNNDLFDLTIRQTGDRNKNYILYASFRNIQLLQGQGANTTSIGQFRFNGFGLPQAPATAGWQNNSLQVVLSDYTIQISEQGLAQICAQNTKNQNKSIPLC